VEVKMANNHKLKDEFDHFKKKTTLYFEMYYEIREPKIYFYYKNGTVTQSGGKSRKSRTFSFADEAKLLLSIEFTRDSSGNIIPGHREYEAELDIGIRDGFGHTEVTVKTIDNGIFTGLYWYQSKENPPAIESIMTENDKTDLYGELFYSIDGGHWKRKIPADCRFIQFKAKEKALPREAHKFSYNVRMPDVDPFLEIDPEIQNPKA
jgi:hypothetical protein